MLLSPALIAQITRMDQLDIPIEKKKQCNELFDKACGLMKKEEYREALKVLDELIDFEPKYPWAYSNKAEVLFQLDSLDECQKLCDKTIRVMGDNELSWNLRGYIYEKRKNFAKALECFDESNKINPGGVAMLHKVNALHELNRKEEEYKEIRTYLFYHPKDKDALCIVGSAFLENNDLDTALYYAEKALSIDRTYKNALSLKASVFYEKKDYKNAIKYFKKANDGSIKSFYTISSLIEVYIVSSQYEDCFDYLEDLEKMKLDDLQRLEFLYLKLIANCLANKNTDADQIAFTNLLQKKIEIHWHFSKTDAWLARAKLTPQQRTLIEDITKKFKECVGRGNRHSNHDIEAKH